MRSRRELRIEIFDIYPTTLGHCPHYNLLASEMAAAGAEFCELSSQVTDYPDDIIRSHDRAVEVAHFLKKELQEPPVDVSLEMVNLLSPAGFLKALRHRIKRRFAIVVDGKKVCEGEPDWKALKLVVQKAFSVQRSTE